MHEHMHAPIEVGENKGNQKVNAPHTRWCSPGGALASAVLQAQLAMSADLTLTIM